MNVAASSFRPDLAKKAFESTFDIERELKSVQKKLPPFAPECDYLRDRLRKAYEDVIFLDFNFAHEQDVENSLWMKVHHKTIEAYRSRINKFNATHGRSKPVEFRKLLLNFTNFIKDATKYYRNFVQRLILHFKVSELGYVIKEFKMEAPVQELENSTYSKELKDLVVRSCHVSLIYLGDLSRYRELQAVSKNGKKNWGPALGYYQFARRLLPNAGAPMNQLAVVAIYTENVLESTYYFLRAICAVKEFPTARDNLALGFKKVLIKEKSTSLNVAELYIRLHAGIYLQENYDNIASDQNEVLQLLRKSILERVISTNTLSHLACINIGAAFAVKRSAKGSTPVTSSGKIESYLKLNVAFVSLLLGILSEELCQVTANSEDISTQVSAVVRRMLPALRICSKWFKVNLLDARPLWDQYVRAMTLCGSKFPRTALPALNQPLEEDMDMRGFAPLEGGLDAHTSKEGEIGGHPNNEVLGRISALLTDAADLARRIVRHSMPVAFRIALTRKDRELARTLSGKSAPSQGEDVAPNSTFYGATPSFDRTGLATINRDAARQSAGSHVEHEAASVSHASEPSMAFSLNQMVDSLVGDEEIVFKGRKHTSAIDTPSTTQNAVNDEQKRWNPDSPMPMPLWPSSGPAPTPNQGR